MDPFEEFEFKPLTEGLGFHRKNSKADSSKPHSKITSKGETKAETPKSSLLSEALFKNPRPAGLDLLDDEPTLKSPLPRRSTRIEESRLTPTSSAVDEILKTLSDAPTKTAKSATSVGTSAVSPALNKSIHSKASPTQKVGPTQSAAPSKGTAAKTEDYAPDVVSFAAFLLDALLILASGLLCMILLLAVTKVDLIANITHPDKQGFIYLSTFSVFFGVSFIYYTVNRAFLGYTPGEWAYDQRLGRPEDMNNLSYIPKCILRWTIIVLTGVVFIPLISKIIQNDFLGEWLELPLMRKI